MRDVPLRRQLPALLVLAALAGCGLLGSPRPERTRFYTLAAIEPQAVRGGAPEFAVGLGPVHWPGYLERPQLATRRDAERVVYAPFDRWAEPLHAQFNRGLADRLMTGLGTDDVTVFPWWPGRRIDVAVEVNVVAFEADASGMARLDALWRLRDTPDGRVFDDGQVGVREPIGPGGAESAVAALGRALDQLADAIVADLRRVRR